jgi:hypothetical protein
MAKVTKKARAVVSEKVNSLDDYSKDPDKGERPYKDYETSDMANHVSKAVEILNHPHKKKAVMGHFEKQKKTIKSFEDLHKKIGQEME